MVLMSMMGCGKLTPHDADVVPPPASFNVTELDPNAGSEAGGLAVEVRGTDFTDGVITVEFGVGNLATSVLFVSATSITCVSPAGGPGPVDVIVTIGAESDTVSPGFVYE